MPSLQLQLHVAMYSSAFLSLRVKGSPYFPFSDHSHYPFAHRVNRCGEHFSSLSSSFSASHRFPVSHSILYGLRQSSLLQLSASRRPILGGVGDRRCYRVPGYGVGRDVYETSCFVKEGSDGRRGGRRRRVVRCIVSEEDGGECEKDQEATATDGDSGATIDLKLPRRRLLVQFTCNECGERTSRLVNRLAYERGLVFVQCAGCLRHHKLVDNLGLIVEYDLREEANVRTDIDQDIIS